MATKRYSAADFVRDVSSRTNGTRVWTAVQNADNATYSIKVNGVVVYSKVFWPGGASAITDANPSGDRVIIFSNDDVAVQAEADTVVFLNTLN